MRGGTQVTHAGEAGSTVGVVGLGAMGLPIAERLAAAGWPTIGYDVAEAARSAAVDRGLALVEDLPALAAEASIVLVIVPADDDVRTVVSGLLAADRVPELLAICSSVEPQTVRDLGVLAQARGVDVCDATLARGEPAARDGTLLVYCGGEDSAIARLLPILRSCASDVVHVGPLGQGQLAKMLNNLLLWSIVVATAETTRLGLALGADPDAMLRALNLGSGRSWVLETWTRPRPMPDADEDMERILEHAEAAGIDLPNARVVAETIRAIKAEKAVWRDGAGVQASMAEFIREHHGARVGAE
jgi:3-hydroxyisobutyrate dehydrogenase-like beta-hydroxyacid dehydrogenase